jgi:hypothetical protein
MGREGRGGIDDHGEELRGDSAVEPVANNGIVAVPLRGGIHREHLLQYMILEGVLLHGIGEHATLLEIVGGGELEGDQNDGVDARESGSKCQGEQLWRWPRPRFQRRKAAAVPWGEKIETLI